MFIQIECPTPAYRRIQGSGLAQRILEKKEHLDNLFLYDNIYGGEGEALVRKAREELGKSPEQRQILAEISSFADEFDAEEKRLDEFKELVASHPVFLAYFILGDEIVHPERFGFPSRRTLEQAITSFCIGENHLFRIVPDDVWVWRNGRFKNQVHLNKHGDLYACQKDVSGKEKKYPGLFGPIEEVECLKRVEHFPSIYSDQDWSGFLVSLLKYAEATGKRHHPVIVGWEKILAQVGARGTNTAECMFGDGNDWEVDFLLETPILTEGRKLESFPLKLPCKELLILPRISGGKLIYMTQVKHGGETIPEFKGTRYESCRFTRGITYDEKDLPEALKASYKFFARDRTLLPKIMNGFLQERAEK